MRLRLSNALLSLFAAALVVFLVLLPFHAFISTWGGTAIGPLFLWKSWPEVLLLALAPLAIAYLFLQPDVWQSLWSRWINRLVILYLAINIVWAVLSPANMAATFAGLAFNLRFLAVFMLAQLVVAGGAQIVHKIRKFAGPWLLIVVVVVSVMAIAQVVFLPADFLAHFGYSSQTISPYILVDQNKNALRAFATMRGPNELGSYLILPLMLALALVIDQKRNILAGVALGLGVVALGLTGSRSAWLGAGVALVVLGLLALPKHRLAKWIRWGAVSVALAGGFVLWLATAVPQVRLAVFHSSPGDSSLFEGSSQKHWEASYAGAKDALAHPLGQGVGTAGPASFYNTANPKIAEDYYIQIAQETGVVGVLTFLAINILLAMQLWRQRSELWAKLLLASLVGISVINLFLHGWSDDPTAMTWWLIAGLYVFAPRSGKIKGKS